MIVGPSEGRYGMSYVGGIQPGDGTQMTPTELGLCGESDDNRFSSSGDDNYLKHAYHLFRFDLSALNVTGLTSYRFLWEGHPDYTPPLAGTMGVTLWRWIPDNAQWMYPGSLNGMTTDFELFFTQFAVATPPTYVPLADMVDGDGMAWMLVFVSPSIFAPHTLSTDLVTFSAAGRLSTAHSPTGQRFRVFDDGDAGQVSFERLDHPAGAWSTPTQPFGEGSNTPDIECLADGRLRCALIDSDGNLQQFYSSDDGESWA